VNRNHPIIIRFPGPNHPISARPRFIARPESTDNRPIFRRQSSDAAAKIVRDRQAKRPSRQSPTICSAADPVEFPGIWETVHNLDFNSGEFATIKDSELEEKSVIRKFRITAADGKNYDTGHYNLSAIVQDRLFVSDFDAEVMRIARNDDESGNEEGGAE
jgi:hypothetical protein